MQADLVLAGRVRREGEASLRAVLPRQDHLQETEPLRPTPPEPDQNPTESPPEETSSSSSDFRGHEAVAMVTESITPGVRRSRFFPGSAPVPPLPSRQGP